MENNGNALLLHSLQIAVKAYEGSQALRIGLMNRVRDVIQRKDRGLSLNETQEKQDEKKYDEKYADKNLIPIWKKLLEEERITQEEYNYVWQYLQMIQDIQTIEKRNKKLMKEAVTETRLYQEFLDKIKGIGIVLSTKLLNAFGFCSNYNTISKLWCHTGSHVLEDGTAPKVRADMRFNPQLRTLAYLIGISLMRSNKGFYRKLYDDEKERQKNKEYKPGFLHEKYPQKKKGKDKYIYDENATNITLNHAHNRALRKVWKIFLSHYWVASRELTGQETTEPYVQAHLKHTDIVSWQDAVEMEGILDPEEDSN